jgi:hypothetical protein
VYTVTITDGDKIGQERNVEEEFVMILVKEGGRVKWKCHKSCCRQKTPVPPAWSSEVTGTETLPFALPQGNYSGSQSRDFMKPV